jgi:hypothetical protein
LTGHIISIDAVDVSPRCLLALGWPPASHVAHPGTVVELGTETFPVRGRVARGGERTEIWEAQKVDAPMFADYEKTASRDIPVVILERT